MQCPGSLKRPLWDVIKSIGRTQKRHHWLPSTQRKAKTHTTSTFPANRQYATSAAAPHSLQNDDNGTVKIRYPLTTPPPPTTPDFDAAVQSAKSRPRDGLKPRMKDGSDLNLRYYKRQYREHEFEEEKTAKAYMRQKQRDANLWRTILHMLDQATPFGKPHHERRTEAVILPHGLAAKFRGHAGPAILEIMERTQCHVQIDAEFSVDGHSNAFTGLILQGTISAINDAIELLPAMVQVMKSEDSGESTKLKDYTLSRQERQSESKRASHDGSLFENSLATSVAPDAVPPRARSIWAESRIHTPRPDRAQLKEMVLSSSVDFTAYVADLTKDIPRLVSRQLPEDKSTKRTANIHNVMDDLVSLFSDEQLTKFATSRAVNRTFQYCVKHSKYNYIRQIYIALEANGYKFTSSNFDVLLAAAAREGDIHNFDYTLKVMQQNNLSPTTLTWASLHDLVRRRFPKQAGLLISTMRSKGLFEDNQTVIEVIKNTIQQHLIGHLTNEGDVESFIKLYDNQVGTQFRRPGFNWLNDDTMNRVIATLITVGRTQEAFRVVAEFRNRDLDKAAANTATLNIFLTQSYKDKDPSSAVAALKHFYVGYPGALVPDKITYRILFFIAWHRRYFNMLRVIWRYGCAAGHVSFEMETQIRRSLITYAPKMPDDGGRMSRGDAWHAWAGKFAIGVAHDLPTSRLVESSGDDERPLPRSLDDSEKRLVELASQSRFEPGSPESQARFRELRGRFDDDQNEAGNCAPSRPFGDLLEEAWREDVRWKEEGLGSRKNLQDETNFAEMLRRGVKVSMRPGDFTQETRKWEVPWTLQRTIREAEAKAMV